MPTCKRHPFFALKVKYIKGQRMLCPFWAVGFREQSLRLICLIVTTATQGQPLVNIDDFVCFLSEKVH